VVLEVATLFRPLYRKTSKVTIITGSSVLRTVWGSVLRIYTHGGAGIRCFCVYLAPPCERICKIGVCHIFGTFFANFARNHPRMRFSPFWHFFLQILPELKNFLQKSKCVHHSRTSRHLCATSDVLRHSQSWGIALRKTVTQSPRQTPTQPDTQTDDGPRTQTPSSFHHPWTTVQSTKEYYITPWNRLGQQDTLQWMPTANKRYKYTIIALLSSDLLQNCTTGFRLSRPNIYWDDNFAVLTNSSARNTEVHGWQNKLGGWVSVWVTAFSPNDITGLRRS